jgi:hypothetical protein
VTAPRTLAETTPAGHAIVMLGRRHWTLAPGEALTFGRGSDRRLRFADDPVDDLVSRSAGVLVGQPDGVLVRNGSRKRALILQAVPGPEFEIPPLMTMGTMPYPRARVVVLGAHGARYVIGVDTTRLRPSEVAAACPQPPAVHIPRRAAGTPTTAGYERLDDLSDGERRFLAALCEPLLTKAGAASVPGTYADIASRCAVSPRTVRNVLDQLRLRLTAEFGIPGLTASDEAAATGRTSYLGSLARWAVDSGNVTAEDLEVLDDVERAARRERLS